MTLRASGGGADSIHAEDGQGFRDLEQAVDIVRPNGKKARQLVHLMAWLDPSATAIDAAELSAAARLMNWLRIDPRAKELQIAVFIDEAKRKLAAAKANVPAFTGEDWPTALWTMDILHGRGSHAQLRAAMAAANREQALKAIGWPTYRRRIQHIDAAAGKTPTNGHAGRLRRLISAGKAAAPGRGMHRLRRKPDRTRSARNVGASVPTDALPRGTVRAWRRHAWTCRRAGAYGASSTPHEKSNCSELSSTAGIGAPVGLYGNMFVAAVVGAPVLPNEA